MSDADPGPIKRLFPEREDAAPSATAIQITIDDARHPPREVFVIGRMIPFAKSSVLFGPQSVGKSAWAAQLAFAFAAGESILWGLPLHPGGGPVLVITAEDSLDDWKRKAAALLQDGKIDVARALERIYILDRSVEGIIRLSEIVTMHTDEPDGSRITRRFARPTEEQDRVIAEALRVGAKLILVETASRLVDDEDNPAMSAAQSALGRVARATEAATLTSHHATKAATKDNDSSLESARGGGAFTNNARNVISIFPAADKDAEPFEDRFPAADLVTLTHGKSTSSTRRHGDIVLVRCDAVHGAVFHLPDEAALSPEQAKRNAERVEQAREKVSEELRRLYAVVENLLALGTVSPNKLEERENREAIGVARARIKTLVKLALDRGVLAVATRNERGITLGLGHDPRRAVNGDPVSEEDAP